MKKISGTEHTTNEEVLTNDERRMNPYALDKQEKPIKTEFLL